MAFKSQFANFISGGIGSFLAFTQVADPITQHPAPQDSNAIIVSIVTIVGGLVSTLLTNLLKGLFNKKKKN